MIWEGQSVVHRADVQVPKTYREARKNRLVPALFEDLAVLQRPIHLPVIRRHEHGGLELIFGQKRVAANDKAKLESFPAEIITCTDEEADYIREAENTHRVFPETKKEKEAWNKSSLELVEKRKALLEAQVGKPVPKAAAIEAVAKARGIKPGSVAQQNRRERRKAEKTNGAAPAEPVVVLGHPDEGARLSEELAAKGTVLFPEPPPESGPGMSEEWLETNDPQPFAFDFLETEEREDIREYVGNVHALLLQVAEHAKAAEEALSGIFALSGEDQNPDPQLMGLSYYTVVLSQLQETALASLPRSICPDCKGSDSTCETCQGSIWVP